MPETCTKKAAPSDVVPKVVMNASCNVPLSKILGYATPPVTVALRAEPEILPPVIGSTSEQMLAFLG